MLTRMRSPGVTVCAGALALSLATAAAAQSERFRGGFTGQDMLAFCKAATDDPIKDFERGICIGFIDGFAAGRHVGDTWHAFHHREEKLEEVHGHLCVPGDTSRTRIARIYVAYLEKNADKLKWNAGVLLEGALREAFPCPK